MRFSKGHFIGELIPDLIVDSQIIVDPKVVTAFNDTHMAQMLGYLNITGLKLALLLNFRESRLDWKRVVNDTKGRTLIDRIPSIRRRASKGRRIETADHADSTDEEVDNLQTFIRAIRVIRGSLQNGSIFLLAFSRSCGMISGFTYEFRNKAAQ